MSSLRLRSIILLQLQGKQFIHKREAPFCSTVATAEGVVLFLLLLQLLGEKPIDNWDLEVSFHSVAATSEGVV